MQETFNAQFTVPVKSLYWSPIFFSQLRPVADTKASHCTSGTQGKYFPQSNWKMKYKVRNKKGMVETIAQVSTMV